MIAPVAHRIASDGIPIYITSRIMKENSISRITVLCWRKPGIAFS